MAGVLSIGIIGTQVAGKAGLTERGDKASKPIRIDRRASSGEIAVRRSSRSANANYSSARNLVL